MTERKRASKYTVRIDNVYFLSRVGLSLRWATQGMPQEQLSADVKRLLAGLARLEAQEAQEAAARKAKPPDRGSTA